MAYIGQQPFQEFASVPTKDSFTGDGSTTTFDLANDVVRGGENALEVFINNVRQEPGSGKSFTLGVDGSNNYRRITFTAAPASGAAIYVLNDKTNLSAIAPVNTDFNGGELVLDADADTTLHADTDDEIDRLNILEARFLAMARAISDLRRNPDYVIVDGNKVPDLPYPAEFVVKGDSRSLSIAAASIVAKVTRDNIMVNLAKTFTGYGWERNAGYGTQEHKLALERLGVTEHHRKSYAPIIKILSK